MVQFNFNPEEIDTPGNSDKFSLPAFLGVSEDRADEMQEIALPMFSRETTETQQDLQDAYQAVAPAGPQEEAYFWHLAGQIMRRAQDEASNPLLAMMRGLMRD
jgi:hypothetical protein